MQDAFTLLSQTARFTLADTAQDNEDDDVTYLTSRRREPPPSAVSEAMAAAIESTRRAKENMKEKDDGLESVIQRIREGISAVKGKTSYYDSLKKKEAKGLEEVRKHKKICVSERTLKFFVLCIVALHRCSIFASFFPIF